jgi:hypothetical protein
MLESTARIDESIRAVPCSNQAASTVRGLLIALTFILFAEIGCSNGPARPTESVRLHVVAVLYGKYLAAHEGQMPASQEELVKFVDTNEQDLLQRRGFKAAEELFAEPADKSRILVLYRDQRDRLHTDFVAIEERKLPAVGAEGKKIASKWFAADILGAAKEIDEQQAKRVLAEAG